VSVEGVLVDTCIFIDALRDDSILPKFDDLALRQGLFLSGLVRLELIYGAKLSEQLVLRDLLEGFPYVPFNEQTVMMAELTLQSLKTNGITIGLIDVFLALQAREQGLKLWTRDKQLIRAAKILKTRLYLP
jgi:predicted nucleic acid-binding protein